MDPAQTCPRCGAARLANTPAGLCPRCLLAHGLRAGPIVESGAVVVAPSRADRPRPGSGSTLSISRRSSHPPGILSALDESVGPVPRVLLQESWTDAERPALACSETMPITAGDAGRYQLHGEVARGGMGVVLRGRDVDLGRDVAVKVLLERHRDNPEMVRRFAEEAQIAGQLQHPGIVPVYELGRLPDARLYIAMKLIRGRTLAALLDARADAAEDRTRYLAIFEQVCQTMAYAHSCSVIHRDLKPSNVMVGNFGEVQVMDWGLAKVIDRGGVADEGRSPHSPPEPVRTLRTGSTADESLPGSVLGTPSYMAPEQARGQLDTLDERADVFGLGAILCEILTGLPPYTATGDGEIYRKAARADLAEARDRLDSCGADAELVALTKSCLAAAPRDRPRNAGVVAAAVSHHLASAQERLQAAELARARAESRAAEERKRRLLAAGLAAALLALAVLGGGGGLWLTRQRSARVAAATRDATTALHETSLLLSRARTAPGTRLTPWVEATQAARRAEALLSRPEVSIDLRHAIRNLLATVARERSQAEARSKDLRTLERLTAIHNDMALRIDRGVSDRDYAAAFRDYGIDVDRLPPSDAGARVAASPIAAEMVNALDQWTFIRRASNPENATGASHLSAVARAADPDPWRCRLRDALDLRGADRESSHALFEELAASAPEDVRHRESISRLAFVLRHLGSETLAISLLRRTQRAHPDDFWINFDLATSLLQSGQSEEAVRFSSVAVAIRPESDLARQILGEALRAAGRTDEAAAYPRNHWLSPPPESGKPTPRGPGGPSSAEGREKKLRRSVTFPGVSLDSLVASNPARP